MFHRKDLLAAALLAAAIVFFFFDLFTLQKTFVSGDHRDQQYPWAKFYQSEIHQGRLPWWTTQIHAGFPLLAEGQIGAFYPLNWLFFYFLPAHAAYNGIILFQYFLGALFFYGYLRHSSRSVSASFFAALIWLFGSTQGGYFYYNYISQKVVIWIPLVLWLTEHLLQKVRFRDAFALACIFAVMIFGGYLQVAVYSLLFSGMYFLFFWFKNPRLKTMLYYGLAGALGILFSLVQLLPTYELSLLSSRAGAAKEIAYLGSMNPLGILTLFYPSWDGFLGSEWYLGLLGLFFFILGAFQFKNVKAGFFLLATLLFALLAMGKAGLIYAAIIEITHFHSFRTPVKFIFFSAFSMTVLSAYGWDAFFGIDQSKMFIKKASLIFLIPASILAAAIPVMNRILSGLKPVILPRLKDFVAAHIFGKPGHSYSLDYYQTKAEGFYDSILQMVSLSDPWTRWQAGFLMLTVLGIALMLRYRHRWAWLWKIIMTGLLLMDLYAYGFTSIRANFGGFDVLDSGKPSRITEFLKNDPSRFRVMEIYTQAKENEIFPFMPCANMLYGIEDLGAYSPLAVKDYAEFFDGWAYVNDSLTLRWVSPEKVIAHSQILGALNVKYFLSVQPIQDDRFPMVEKDGGVFLYRNSFFRERAIFFPGASEINSLQFMEKEPGISIPFDSYAQNRAAMTVNASAEGILFVSDLMYPGWKVFVDGYERPIKHVMKLFRGVFLEAGTHQVTMEYRPVFYRGIGFFSTGVFFILLLGILIYEGCLLRSWSRRVETHHDEHR